ncbi:MAG: zf-TFIIB domain-containing protein [Phycisphaerae bacterium]|nr:zf-TFIIB domain-containing protein [Phycisphaerae bacterium]
MCKSAMIVLELDEVEIDYCTDCRGIWLDSGELELLLGGAGQSKEVLQSFNPAETREAARKCPICLKKMEKVLVGGAGKSELIDRCKKQHGLWFDAGELENVLKMGHFDDEGKVPRLLSELFQADTEDKKTE